MQPTDHAVSERAADNAERTVTPVADALVLLYRAYQKTSVFPPGHPAVPRALARAAQGLASATAQSGAFTIKSTGDQLFVADAALVDPTGALTSLAVLFQDLDVAEVRFEPGLGAAELEAFISTLGRARREEQRGPALVALMAQRPFEHLSVSPVRHETVEASSPDGAHEDHPRPDIWSAISSMLADPTPGPVRRSPEQLAAEVHYEIERHEGTGVSRLHERVDSVSREIGTIRPEWRVAVRKRLAKFVAALNPRLRQDLLRFDAQRPGEPLSLIGELGDVIPETDLLEALQNIDRSGDRLPGQLLTLLNKLLRISESRPSLATSLEDLLRNWGVEPSESGGDITTVREALEEVFRRRTRADCNPEPHQALLDRLASQEFAGNAVSSEAIYRDPRDAADTGLHVAEITAQLLRLPGGEIHRASLLRRMIDNLDTLLDHGAFDAIRDSSLAARAYAENEDEPEETRRAALAYIVELRSDRRMGQILSRAREGERFPAAAASLIGVGGVHALERVLEALASNPTPTVAETLRSFAAAARPEDLEQVLRARREQGWSALRTVFPVLRELDPRVARPLLEALLDHEEFKVRRETLLVLDDLGGDDRAFLEDLRLALADASDEVVEVVIQCLTARTTRASRESLGDYLDGSLLGSVPPMENALRAAQGLARMGESGRARLCRALGALGRSLRPSTARLSRRVADLLRQEERTPELTRCLRSWRWSPAGLLSMVLPREKT